MDSQREKMQELWEKYKPDIKRVIKEYAACEKEGKVNRKSNKLKKSPNQYAKELLNDGLRKGWLKENINNHNSKCIEKSFTSENIHSFTGQSKDSWIEWSSMMADKFDIIKESPEYLEAVYAWRYAWRPDRVRILLVAESHVAEEKGDLNVQVLLPDSERIGVHLPKNFCRLVYCLGYGENEVCCNKPVKNFVGTWQYWDLIGTIAARINRSIRPKMPRKINSNLQERLAWKISVLTELKKSGIWLVDASVIAVYKSGGKRLISGKLYQEIVKYSFEKFVWPNVGKDEPEQIWVIGIGVGEVLKSLPMIQESQIISQPQDRDVNRYKLGLDKLIKEIK